MRIFRYKPEFHFFFLCPILLIFRFLKTFLSIFTHFQVFFLKIHSHAWEKFGTWPIGMDFWRFCEFGGNIFTLRIYLPTSTPRWSFVIMLFRPIKCLLSSDTKHIYLWYCAFFCKTCKHSSMLAHFWFYGDPIEFCIQVDVDYKEIKGALDNFSLIPLGNISYSFWTKYLFYSTPQQWRIMYCPLLCWLLKRSSEMSTTTWKRVVKGAVVLGHNKRD